MSQRLKRWESPRKEGRNDKGKGGSARQRQLKKRTQMLRQKLKDQGKDNNSQGQHQKGEKIMIFSPFLWAGKSNLALAAR
jgi:orotate phosphoribosyltransferase